MKRIGHIIKKEILEIIRDYQSFLVLIIMPMAFILVMSLSMQALFQSHSKFKINVLVANHDGSAESKKFIDILKTIQTFSIKEAGPSVSAGELTKEILSSDYKFALVINKTFSPYIVDLNKSTGTKPVDMLVDPTMQMLTQLVVKNKIEMEITKMRLNAFFSANAELLTYVGFNKDTLLQSIEGVLATNYVYKDRREAVIPSAAQQSVPAWLVFSMYFLVITMSTIFFTEKNNGTFQRLRSINLKSRYIIGGKIFSYYLVSLIQAVSMLCVGKWIVPLLGGDTIELGNSFGGLFAVASCTGLNAISYGLFISSVSKNSQMAEAIGVVGIVVMAAIGGIMVPKFVMPAALQALSNISPLSWGMEGFLDIMLRKGTIVDVLPRCALLLGTGIVMLFATGIIIRKKII